MSRMYLAVEGHGESEVFFLPCIHLMASKPLKDERNVSRAGLLPNAEFRGDPQSVRGVKEWITRHMPPGRSYKPTLDQLPMTRMIDFNVIRHTTPTLPCFGTMERALKFLSIQISDGKTGVYPC